jgi:peptidoglycan hydrolase CwlO-like protein
LKQTEKNGEIEEKNGEIEEKTEKYRRKRRSIGENGEVTEK